MRITEKLLENAEKTLNRINEGSEVKSILSDVEKSIPDETVQVMKMDECILGGTLEQSAISESDALSINDEEMKRLEEIASKDDETISFQGERKDGWCKKTICQGQFSSYACSGCIGKASNHKTI